MLDQNANEQSGTWSILDRWSDFGGPGHGPKWTACSNPVKFNKNKVVPRQTTSKTRQAIDNIGQNGATGGNSPSCGSCIPFLGLSPATRDAALSKTLGSNAKGAYAFGPRRGEQCGFGRQIGVFASVLRGAALCSVVLISGPAAAEGWVRVGGDKWETTERVSMRSQDRTVSRVSADGWVSLNRFDERARPSVAKPRVAAWTPPPMGSEIEGLRQILRLAESHKAGYDAIHHSAKRLPSKRPTQMTLGEILAWIDATPGQHHAIGLYQIIPKTLKRLMAKTGLSPTTIFTPQVQDHLGDVLIVEAGYADFRKGSKSADDFMDGLAHVWAGLPLRNGKSAYHGLAGNRATISRQLFATQMQRIFGPVQLAKTNAGG